MRHDTFGARSQQQRLLERARCLEARPGIEELAVRRWPNRLAVDGPSEFADRIREFEAWAAEHGLSLAPCFQRREADTAFVGEGYEQVVLPIMCLAVYRDGVLQHVAPHVNGRRAYTVHDCIADLEEGLARQEGRSPRRIDPTADPDARGTVQASDGPYRSG
jgi:hypothetical protein